jgi:hypothetical protein
MDIQDDETVNGNEELPIHDTMKIRSLNDVPQVIDTTPVVMTSYADMQGKDYTFDEVVNRFAQAQTKEDFSNVLAWRNLLKPKKTAIGTISGITPVLYFPKVNFKKQKPLALLKKYVREYVLAKLIQLPQLMDFLPTLSLKVEQAKKFREIYTSMGHEVIAYHVGTHNQENTPATYTVIEGKGNERKVIKLPYVALDIMGIPYPDYSGENTRVAYYAPQFFTVGYNIKLMQTYRNFLEQGRFGGQKSTEEAMELYEDLNETAATHVFSSGTLDGMLNRLSTMLEAATEVRVRAQPWHQEEKQEMILYMNKHFPQIEGVDLPDLLNTNVIDITKLKIQLPDEQNPIREVGLSMNAEANPGPMFSTYKIPTGEYNESGKEITRPAKKADVILQDFTIATRILEALADNRYTEEERLKNYWDTYPDSVVFFTFGKAEAYTIKQRHEKTRLIAVHSSCYTLVASLMTHAPLKYTQICLDRPMMFTFDSKNKKWETKGGVLSLLHFNAYSGNTDRLLQIGFDMIDLKVLTIWPFIYSDNIYLVIWDPDRMRRPLWVSLDLVKAESTITYEHV